MASLMSKAKQTRHQDKRITLGAVGVIAAAFGVAKVPLESRPRFGVKDSFYELALSLIKSADGRSVRVVVLVQCITAVGFLIVWSVRGVLGI
jgi:hypothetical protein